MILFDGETPKVVFSRVTLSAVYCCCIVQAHQRNPDLIEQYWTGGYLEYLAPELSMNVEELHYSLPTVPNMKIQKQKSYCMKKFNK